MKFLRTFVSLAVFAAAATPALAQTVIDPTLVVENMTPAGGLSGPTCMVHVSPTQMLVTEKNTGKVRRVLNGVVQAGQAIDLPVNSSSERGLLGIALDPLFASNNLVYLYYTVAPTDGGTPTANRVARFTWNAGAGTLSGEQLVIDLPVTTGPNHDGGIITFGPPTAAPADQKLYIIIGDLNRNGQNQNNTAGGAPAPDNSGCVIRLNPNGSIPSTATDKGPFFDVAGTNDALKSMYAYGIRNSFGMDFDPVTGALWDTENGPSSNDEINRIDPAFNSGWDTVMGFQASAPTGLVQFSGVGTYSNPEFTWASVVAPTALHFFRSAGLGAGYQHDCFAGANNNGKLYRFEPNGPRTGFTFTDPALVDTVLGAGDTDTSIVFGTDWGVITDIDTGPDGFMYVTSLSKGNIYRIKPITTAAENWELYD